MDRSYEQPLQHALEHALRWLDNLDDAPVNAVSTIADLRRTLGQPLADAGMAPSQVIDQLVAATEPGLTATGSGRFHGWVIGGALPAALAADWMTAAWDQNAGALAAAPAAAVIEEVAGTWLKELLNIPAQASFTFCTGSQTGHVIALAAARHAVLDAVGWDVEQRGLAG
ncbi:MAG TPA: pyridoxal-dependent decarboxylase, partial [Thermomicrobiales bacterium]|nr:pyridoxal-dependent decarboxylase [Thermomicrobiales bacterium]